MDHEAVEVADDQQRRVLQRLAAIAGAAECGVEVLVLALVLPAEVAALPDVGPAFAAVVFVAPRSKQ